MSTSALQQEIADLRAELLALKKKQKAEKAQATPAPSQKSTRKKRTTEAPEDALKKVVASVLAQVKEDYDNLSPVTAVLLFALGAMLGGALAKGRGGR
ncbi:MAG: hypothetical protein P1U32_00370 [Legionellaceae bacterium]|nr:hypothetical protein [Legionellaceae bacterium]